MLGEYCKVPCGNTVVHRDIDQISTSLKYNEYIVFDQTRIRIKFIVHCERRPSRPALTQTIPAQIATIPIRLPAPNASQTTTNQNLQVANVPNPMNSGQTTNSIQPPVATTMPMSSGAANNQNNNSIQTPGSINSATATHQRPNSAKNQKSTSCCVIL